MRWWYPLDVDDYLEQEGDVDGLPPVPELTVGRRAPGVDWLVAETQAALRRDHVVRWRVGRGGRSVARQAADRLWSEGVTGTHVGHDYEWDDYEGWGR